MRAWSRLTLSVALLQMGCGAPGIEESSTETMSFETGSNRPRVLVRLDEGSIEVSASDSAGIELELVKRARAFDRDGARSLLSVIRTDTVFENDTLSIRSTRGLRSEISFGASLRADVHLRVPREVELDLYTLEGGIDLRGIRGMVAAGSEDGPIRLRDVGGAVKLRASDGSILGSELQGDLDVTTVDGRIELRGDFGVLEASTSDGDIRVSVTATRESFGDWSIRTSDGSIVLTLPEELSARLAATVADGDIENGLARFRGRQTPKSVEGILGGGGPLILVTTMDGNVTLRNP